MCTHTRDTQSEKWAAINTKPGVSPLPSLPVTAFMFTCLRSSCGRVKPQPPVDPYYIAFLTNLPEDHPLPETFRRQHFVFSACDWYVFHTVIHHRTKLL